MNEEKSFQFGHCQVCGKEDYVINSHYFKHTGLILLMLSKTIKGYMCKDCNARIYKSCQIYSALAGWWGLFSFFILNPGTLIANFIMYTRSIREFNNINNRVNVISNSK
jgi:hypothetical protein